jgi:hypothetical protein
VITTDTVLSGRFRLDSLLEQEAEARCTCDDSFGSETGFGEPKMERVVTPARQHAVDVDQILDPRHLGAEDNALVAHARGLGECGRLEGTLDHGLHHHVTRVAWSLAAGVGIHHRCQKRLVQ